MQGNCQKKFVTIENKAKIFFILIPYFPWFDVNDNRE